MRLLPRWMDRRVAAHQRELTEAHYREADNMYRQMRGWRHDYRNHIQLPPEQRMIRVYMDMRGTQLYISFTDLTAGKKLKKENGRFRSTRGEGHGLGLVRGDAIVERLKGYLSRNSEDGAFTTEILLPQERALPARGLLHRRGRWGSFSCIEGGDGHLCHSTEPGTVFLSHRRWDWRTAPWQTANEITATGKTCPLSLAVLASAPRGGAKPLGGATKRLPLQFIPPGQRSVPEISGDAFFVLYCTAERLVFLCEKAERQGKKAPALWRGRECVVHGPTGLDHGGEEGAGADGGVGGVGGCGEQRPVWRDHRAVQCTQSNRPAAEAIWLTLRELMMRPACTTPSGTPGRNTMSSELTP